MRKSPKLAGGAQDRACRADLQPGDALKVGVGGQLSVALAARRHHQARRRQQLQQVLLHLRAPALGSYATSSECPATTQPEGHMKSACGHHPHGCRVSRAAVLGAYHSL